MLRCAEVKNRQAIQVIFSQKKDAVIHPTVFFNGSEVAFKTEHKHQGMILDCKLNFQSHIREAIIKESRGIGIVRFLSKYVSRDHLGQIYYLYVRPHLDFGDIIDHKCDPEFKLDFTRPDRLYEELGWEILYYRRWYRCLCHFYKLRNDQRPYYDDFTGYVLFIITSFLAGVESTDQCLLNSEVLSCFSGVIISMRSFFLLYSEIPQECNLHYNFRRSNVYEPNAISTNRFSHTYFQNCMREWNLLDETIKNSPTLSVFKRKLVCLVRPS